MLTHRYTYQHDLGTFYAEVPVGKWVSQYIIARKPCNGDEECVDPAYSPPRGRFERRLFDHTSGAMALWEAGVLPPTPSVRAIRFSASENVSLVRMRGIRAGRATFEQQAGRLPSGSECRV